MQTAVDPNLRQKKEEGSLRSPPPLSSVREARGGRTPSGADRSPKCYYLMILRATRPPATNKAPAPKANKDAPPAPPVLGSSALGASAGGGAGVALGAGGGGGGGGVQGALATTPPALDSITPSVQSASAFAPPAVAVLALASATTCGLSCAMAIGATATNATASIAASNINFFNASYLLLKGSLSVLPSGAGP